MITILAISLCLLSSNHLDSSSLSVTIKRFNYIFFQQVRRQAPTRWRYVLAEHRRRLDRDRLVFLLVEWLNANRHQLVAALSPVRFEASRNRYVTGSNPGANLGFFPPPMLLMSLMFFSRRGPFLLLRRPLKVCIFQAPSQVKRNRPMVAVQSVAPVVAVRVIVRNPCIMTPRLQMPKRELIIVERSFRQNGCCTGPRQQKRWFGFKLEDGEASTTTMAIIPTIIDRLVATVPTPKAVARKTTFWDCAGVVVRCRYFHYLVYFLTQIQMFRNKV